MEISYTFIDENIKIVNVEPILFLEDIDSMVIADLHLGIEAIMLEDGTLTPYNQTNKIIEKVTRYLKSIKPKKLILNGDVKHSFQEAIKVENRDVKRFLTAVSSLVKEIHIVKGNHDIFLTWVTREISNIKIHQQELILGSYLFCHGDKPLLEKIPEKIKYVIIAHEHPVFSMRINGLRKVVLPTFLFCPLEKTTKKIVVLPALTDYSSGTAITPNLSTNLLSPILKNSVNLDDCETFVLNDKKEVLHFPPFKEWYTNE
ncbi:MAG: metallophosphoesterase [Candidatus Heimdallarchaeaceae archaeon]